MPNIQEFNEVFRRLKAIFQPYAKRMKNKRPLCFGGVRLGKTYVSFYLMSVYACPDFLKTMSSELRKRM